MHLEIGQRVGEYEILALLGAGGMGQVYSAPSTVPPLPHFFATQASQKSAAPVTEAPAPSPSTGGGTAGATSNPPAESPAPAPPPKESATAKTETAPSHQNQSPQPPMPPVRPRYSPDAGKPAPVAADSTPPGPTQQEIAQARERMIQLDAKAEADRAGIQQIRGQQQAQGLDMRGGMLAALNRMNAYVSEANRALNQNDLQTANDDMDRAEKEMAT